MNITEGISRVTGGRVRFQAETPFSAVRRFRNIQSQQGRTQDLLNLSGAGGLVSWSLRMELEGELVDLNHQVEKGPGIRVGLVAPIIGEIPLFEARRSPRDRSKRIVYQDLVHIVHEEADRLATEADSAGEAGETLFEAIRYDEEAARESRVNP